MPKPRALTASEAKATLAHRLGTRLAPRLRQLSTRFGLRAKRVFLVWVRWDGGERGAGMPTVASRVELLPTPRVSDMTAVALQGYAGGTLPVGTLRVDLVSVQYTMDQLTGRAVPGLQVGQELPAEWDFFYEVVEDGRGDDPPARARYRLMAAPDRREGSMAWSLLLERASEDLARDGRILVGPDD